MSRRAVIYVHEPQVPPGYLTEALQHAGFTVTARLRETRPEDVEAPLLVVMGGSMGVYEADEHPFLQDVLKVVGERLKADRPVLGVCLGAQIIAAAAGSRVYPGKAGFELGVLPVRWQLAAREDPALGEIAEASPEEGLPVLEWHGDTFDPVPGATLLASSSRYPWQAFRVGTSYGLQFHPEVDEQILLNWARTWPKNLSRAGVSWTQLERELLPRFHEAQAGMRRLCDSLVGYYGKLLG